MLLYGDMKTQCCYAPKVVFWANITRLLLLKPVVRCSGTSLIENEYVWDMHCFKSQKSLENERMSHLK